MLNYFNIIRLVLKFFFLEIKKSKALMKNIYNLFLNYSLIEFIKFQFNNSILPFKNKNISKFLKKNSKRFELIKKKKNKVLVELLLSHHSEPMMINLLISNDLMKLYNAEIVGLINSDDYLTKKIAESFGIRKFLYKKKTNFFQRLNYFLKSIKLINKKNLKKMKYLRVNNDEVGKAAYEHYLRFHDNKINKLDDFMLYNCLAKSLQSNDESKNIFKTKYKIFVIGETQFVPNKLYFNQSLKQKIPVYTWFGSAATNYTGRLYTDYKERNSGKRKYSKKTANLLIKSLKNQKKILNQIYRKQGVKEIGKETIWSNRKASNELKFNTRLKFNEHFNFSNKIKTILVLPHAMADNVFNNEWNIFNTSYEWFYKICKKINLMDNVNWLIKPHPFEYKFNTVKAVDVFNHVIKKKSNVHFLKEGIHINDLFKYVDVVLTCNGSAGYEYPSMGVNTITTADADYSNFDFTIAPKTQKKYFEILKKISTIKKIKNKKIMKARVYWISILSLLWNNHNFCPKIKQHGFFKKDLFFEKISNMNYLTNNNNFTRDIIFQIENKNRHSINYNFIKKFKKFNFKLNDA